MMETMDGVTVIKEYKELIYDYRTKHPMFYNLHGERIYVTFIVLMFVLAAFVALILELVK